MKIINNLFLLLLLCTLLVLPFSALGAIEGGNVLSTSVTREAPTYEDILDSATDINNQAPSVLGQSYEADGFSDYAILNEVSESSPAAEDDFSQPEDESLYFVSPDSVK